MRLEVGPQKISMPISHLEGYDPNFSGNMSILATHVQEKSVSKAILWINKFLTHFDQMNTPSVIHGWKAMNLSFQAI